jgi:hypothetical protein
VILRALPLRYIISGHHADDGDRVRVDSCKTVNFHPGPKVTVLPKGFYQGDLGYIDPNDLYF